MAAIPKEKPSRIDELRAEFARYKADVKERGKPFYPYAMFHDTIMSLVVVCTIIGLAVIWKWSAWGPHHDPTHKGLLGPEVDPPADPGTTSFVPRPDWYFYFLFYLLRIFKWPESVFLGTVAVLTWKGATAKEALASEVVNDIPSWVKAEKLPANALPGAHLFATAGCTACHTYNGSGGSNLGAPDLTDIGSRNLGIQFQINHLKCPSCVNPGSPMPPFASLGEERLNQLAIFLEASKGSP